MATRMAHCQVRGMPLRDDIIAGFTTRLIDGWDGVHPDCREVWLRQQIVDLLREIRRRERAS